MQWQSTVIGAVSLLAAFPAAAQHPPGAMSPAGAQGSANIHVLSHVALGRVFTVGDIEVEQELSRPYVYVPIRVKDAGFFIISIKDPAKANVIYRWTIENPALHNGHAALMKRLDQAKETTPQSTFAAAPSAGQIHPGVQRYLRELGVMK